MSVRRMTVSLATILIGGSIIGAGQTLSTRTPAVVQLTTQINSEKIGAGTTVLTKLAEKVRLPDGTSIPQGSEIIGIVTSGLSSASHNPQLTFRFSQLNLKKHGALPIRATVLFVATQQFPQSSNPSVLETPLQVSKSLSNRPDKFLVQNVLPGIDLQGDATTEDSGILVSKQGKKISLPMWTKLELGIAVAQ